MPPEKKVARWKLALAYSAFGGFAFVVFLFLTFPYDAVRRRVTFEAARAGWTITMTDLGPGLFGLTAKNVRLEPVNAAPPVEGAPEKQPLVIPRLTLRPSFVPFGAHIAADVFGGEVDGAIGGIGSGSVQLELEDLDPQQGNLKDFTGLDLAGKVNGKLMLTVPIVEVNKVRDYDLSQADGSITLTATGLTVNGGTITVPMYGTPTPMDLPRIVLGEVNGRVKIEKGLGTLEQFTAKGEDLELRADGTVKLAKRPEYSEMDLALKLRAEPEFVKRLGMIGSGLSILPTDRQDPNFRAAKISGMLSRPQFQPGSR